MIDPSALRRIGRSPVMVSACGFGGAPLGDLTRTPSDAAAGELLDRVRGAGIRYFDTAPFYGSGMSEHRLGDFLRDQPRDSYTLSTKVGRLLVPDRAYAMERWGTARAMPFRAAFDFSHDGIIRAHEQSLQRLGLESIDILLLHDLGAYGQKERHAESLATARKGAIPALRWLKEQGLVRAIGLGVNEWQICLEVMDEADWDCFLLASRYTLLDQSPLASFFPRCQRDQVSVIIGAPLASGILATGAIPGARHEYGPAGPEAMARVAAIQAVCARHATPLIAAALAFPLAHPVVASIIPGLSTPAELEQNLVHLRTPVPPALWAELRQLGLLDAQAPVPA